MVSSLYNIPSRYLGSYIKPFHWLGITHKHICTVLQISFYPTKLLFFLWGLLVKLSGNFTLPINVPNLPINHIYCVGSPPIISAHLESFRVGFKIQTCCIKFNMCKSIVLQKNPLAILFKFLIFL